MHIRFPLRPILFAVALLTPLSLALPCGISAASGTTINRAVVKVFATASPPDLQHPWQRAGMESFSGSGVILPSGQILTNAHVVSNAASIDVKLDGATERYPAKIAFIGHASDLALLTVEDPAFFEGAGHLELGSMPGVQDAVEVYGYPEGGESLSITAGVVSRIEIGSYAHSMADLLLVQIDAAINPGNSGGPVVAGNRLVGIATQGRKDSQNIGYMVPLPVIRQFLKDTTDGHVDGPQTLGIGAQDLESPAQRAQHGLDRRETGALVIAVNHGSPAWGALELGDVILSIDGHPIANDLSVASAYDTRLSWVSLLTGKQAGDEVKLQLVRKGERMGASVRLYSWQPLIPGTHMSDVTRYRIFGGLVFQPLTVDYVMIDPKNADPAMMSMCMYHNLRTPDRSESIILSQVLPSEASRGYVDVYDEIVSRVQGRVPRDMADLNDIIDHATGRWLDVETSGGLHLVLDIDQARRATPEILERFAIGADRSPHGKEAVVERVDR